ncbi:MULTISPECIES: hypothetical protein [unclassified Rhodococcus (in: high G+C Gram-positive bacteria)]|uniref:hypothetical protein n=1 Tax=unclassified Rhodococcus (in: high G+C Gram-positive bacteria) TaxID=192944 RepID=UPI003392E726
MQRLGKRFSLLIITNTVVIILIAVFCVVMHEGVRYSDEQGYLELGKGVGQFGVYQLNGLATAYRPPAWPLWISTTFIIDSPGWVVFVIPAILLMASAVLASSIGYRIGGQIAGITAPILVGLYPVNLYTATTLYPQTLALACILALWAMWIFAPTVTSSKCRAVVAVGAGLTASCLALAVPTLALTAAVLLLAVVVTFWRIGARLAAALSVVFAAGTWLIWVVRNYITIGEAVFLSTSSGFNLLLGNSPNATADSGVSADISPSVEYATAHGMGELSRNDFYSTEARSWITSNPEEFSILYVKKLVNYFSPYNEPHSAAQNNATVQALIATVAFGSILVLCIVRILGRESIKMHANEWVVIALFFANGPIMALYFTRTRFRQPLDGLMAVEAAIGLAVLFAICSRFLQHRRQRKDRVGLPL